MDKRVCCITHHATASMARLSPLHFSFLFSLEFYWGVRLQEQMGNVQGWEMNGTELVDMKDTKNKYEEI